MNPYAERQRNLAVLGFKEYDGYLRSALWKSIRQQVLCGQNCVRCQSRRALALHHSSYDLATMRGERLDTLIAVCRGCHKKAEQLAATAKTDPHDRLAAATLFLLSGIPPQQKRRCKREKRTAKKIPGPVFHRPTRLRKARMRWNRMAKKEISLAPRLVRPALNQQPKA